MHCDQLDVILIVSSGIEFSYFIDRLSCKNIIFFNLGCFPVIHENITIQTFAEQPFPYGIENNKILNLRSKSKIEKISVYENTCYNDQLLKEYENKINFVDRDHKVVYFGNPQYLLNDHFYNILDKIDAANCDLQISFWIRKNKYYDKVKEKFERFNIRFDSFLLN